VRLQEGRVQQTNAAVFPPGKARPDWMIIRALSEVLGKNIGYDDVEGVRARLAEVAPHFARPDEVQPSIWLNGDTYAHKKPSAQALEAPFESLVKNFFQTDAISRNSVTMARCTATLA